MKKVLNAVIGTMILLTALAAAQAVQLPKGTISIGWTGCPSVRIWKGPKSLVEYAGAANINSSNVAGAVSTNSIFARCRMLKLYREKNDLNVYIGPGADLNLVSNAGGVSGAGTTGIMVYGVLGIEYFIKAIPGLSLGADITGGLAMTMNSLGGASTTLMNVSFASTGFLTNNALIANALYLRFYF